MSYLGKNIKKYRKLKKLTINELATLSKASPASISLIENDKRDATFKLILNIAEALEIEVGQLVTSPESLKLKHNVHSAVNFDDSTLLFGTSISNLNDVMNWGLVVDLSNVKILEKIYFYSNTSSFTFEEFYNDKLKVYLEEQRLRILLKRNTHINRSFEDVKKRGIGWTEYKETVNDLQKIINTLFIKTKTNGEES
ncbi:helix-turn-helix domain-containing protein [Peribacillus sp. RS7]|uniref:helix-turn-helix domain-containing protein n=1 Tax=Peribacillus sp. RS7 TaxID=3242679 RepID=UPI0035C026C7